MARSTSLDGGQVSVPMMKEKEAFGYAHGKGHQAVELLYEGSELSKDLFNTDQS
jgi:hypothetical protein